MVSLPSGVNEVPPVVATVASQSVSPLVPGQMEGLELDHLPAEAQGEVRAHALWAL